MVFIFEMRDLHRNNGTASPIEPGRAVPLFCRGCWIYKVRKNASTSSQVGMETLAPGRLTVMVETAVA